MDLYGSRELGDREMHVVRLVTEGMKNGEIAGLLHTTEHVIKNYLRAIYDKLGLWNRVELALWYITNIDPHPAVESVTRAIVRLGTREREITTLMAQGIDAAGIAERMKMARRTVKAHKNRLYLRFGIAGGIKQVKLAVLVSRSQPMSQPDQQPNSMPTNFEQCSRHRTGSLKSIIGETS